MQKEPSAIEVLFTKYTRGEVTTEETLRLFKLIGSGKHDVEISERLANELDHTDPADQYETNWETSLIRIKAQAFEPIRSISKRKHINLWTRILTAGAAILFLVFGINYFTSRETGHTYEHLTQNDIAPGKVGATLTLANGKTINLANIARGESIKENGIVISKTSEGQLLYQSDPNRNEAQDLHTLSTALGQTYTLTLPDQTKVWLNAASSLTYHSTLKEKGVRRVQLKGEAYFEVAKDKTRPFLVESGTQTVEVLGTHFNINAYNDEKTYRTTLLEGSVKITDHAREKILTPGYQATTLPGEIKLSKVDTEFAIAWKSNNFTFDRLDIREIMRIIARWYDVDVIYKEEIPSGKFWGSVSRFDHISQVLIPLEATGNVHFKIEGRKVYVYR
ncbi:FecR family protein [Pedobacter sp. BG31]|uniref:FecR family protein n=1 Tax=Pedobacter sp. BG31 TaxID=3349697 RepID=UPI0035F3E9BF